LDSSRRRRGRSRPHLVDQATVQTAVDRGMRNTVGLGDRAARRRALEGIVKRTEDGPLARRMLLDKGQPRSSPFSGTATSHLTHGR
jgi:hypothetical protein